MIDSIIGTFLVLATYRLGYWHGTQMKKKAVKPQSESNGQTATKPKIKHHSPWTNLRNKDRQGDRET
jgi:hypothetical protein